MPVSDNLAIPLFRAFALLEYQLKRRHAFLKADRFGNAMVDWSEVKAQVDRFPPADFVLRVEPVTRQKMLGGARDRPKVQVVVNAGGQREATFEPRPLQPPNEVQSDARALVEATKRVRKTSSMAAKKIRASSLSMATTTNGVVPPSTWRGHCSTSWTKEHSDHPIVPERLRVEPTLRPAPSVSRPRPPSQ